MIDSHCHLDHEPLISDLTNVIQRSKDVGIKKLLTISTSIDSFSKIKQLIKKDDIIYGTVGIHPHESDKNVFTSLEVIRKISFLLYPIIPGSVIKALKIFNLNENNIILKDISKNEYLIKGNKINKIDILFKKIEKNND